jgi:hypothetical protein
MYGREEVNLCSRQEVLLHCCDVIQLLVLCEPGTVNNMHFQRTRHTDEVLRLLYKRSTSSITGKQQAM